jgi:peptidoglycan/xylan/chitin deacetylase (PgdA/CDA1 family)
MTNVRTTKKMVALTLDDGPSSTAQTCEILKRYNAKATFFYVAYRLADSPSSAPSAQSCGEIGNHTYHHILLNLANYATAMTDLGNANRIFMNIIKKKPLYFRPRSGLYTSSVLSAVLNQGSIIVNWSVGANDNGPENPSRATIVNRILNHPNLKPGAIILLHETYDPTREALPTILSELKNRGYTVTTVSELINNSY